MKKDIAFRPVEGVAIAIIPDEQAATATPEQPGWQVYLLNDNDEPLDNVLVSSNGYGTGPAGEPIRTSTLRHSLPQVPPRSASPIEAIDPAVFHLHNQYWVSYYLGGQVFDKKFIFAPESIGVDQLMMIPLIDQAGVLHS